MDISVITGSYRVGAGMDMWIPSLAKQDFEGEFEVVFADEIKEKREKAIEEYIKQFDLNFKHVKAINHPYACPASTYNSALRNVEPETKLIVVLGDFSLVPKHYLQAHWDIYQNYEDTTLTSCFIDRKCPELIENPKIDDIGIFKEAFDKDKFLNSEVVHPEERHHFVHNWINTKLGYLTGEFTLGLISLPKDLFFKLNGFDSHYDGGKGRSDFDLVHRASLLGHRFVLSTDVMVNRIAHPHKNIEDLKFPFTEKVNPRTREDNIDLFFKKAQQLSRRRTLINSHKGIRDLEWLNNKRILVQGGGAEVCTRKWVKILQKMGIPVYHNDMSGNFMFRNITDMIVYGVSPFDFEWTWPHIDNCFVYMFWTGTDAFNVVNHKFGMEIPKHPNLKHLAVSDRLVKELKTMGIEATELLDYEDDVTDNLDTLDKEDNYGEESYPFTVLIYMPSGDTKDFYHYDLMKEIVEEFSDNSSIKFVFYGNKELLDLPGYNDFTDPHRCHQRFYVIGDEKKQLYKETYVYLRHTEHDGIPYCLIEMKKMGRHVIMNYPYPHCIVAYTKEDIVKHINRLYKEFRDGGKPLDTIGMQYYRQTYSKENFIKNFIRIIYGKDCLNKWEGLE